MPEKTCSTCQCNKVCDHNKYGFENCGNYISADLAPIAEVAECEAFANQLLEQRDMWMQKAEELKIELQAMRGAANSYKMHYEKAKQEVVEKFKSCKDMSQVRRFCIQLSKDEMEKKDD